MKYTNVTNCKYVTADNAHIGCQVTFETLGTIYFVASATDVESHGKEIYRRAAAGEFGTVDQYIPQPESNVTLEQQIAIERSTRDKLLAQLDVIVSNPLRWENISSNDKLEISNYRIELLKVPQQDGFPYNITWPKKPEYIIKSIKEVPMEISLY